MTQSLNVHTPYRRVRHPELFPAILKDREERNHGNYLFRFCLNLSLICIICHCVFIFIHFYFIFFL